MMGKISYNCNCGKRIRSSINLEKHQKEFPDHVRGTTKARGLGGKYTGTCPKCGKEWRSSHKNKIYCGMNCYTTSDKFLEMRKERSAQQKIEGRTEIECICCGKPTSIKKSEIAKGRKYCSKLCYREYMSKRFDRYICSPEEIALPHNYDEFLLQDTLPCLIKGCGWRGKMLGSHVNFVHGITAAEFKRIVGFNLTTGLITPDVFKTMSERMHVHLASFPAEMIRGSGKKGTIRSREAKEHWQKQFSLKDPIMEEKECLSCNKKFRPKKGGYNALYCSLECRDKTYYKEMYVDKNYSLICDWCNDKFMGNKNQQKRKEKGGLVFCSPQHKGKWNGSLRKKRRTANVKSK